MLRALEGGLDQKPDAEPEDKLACLAALERKVLWLSTWMIHNANHLRPNRDGLKVGGHQASSASVATLMTALYFDVLRPQDRVAVKPHASPVFHAIQYLLGHQTRDKLERFRAFGGAQSYPSRTKDGDIVDFSTGSVGLGVGMTLFSSIAQDYLRLKELVPTDEPPGRMIALAGDAELDEGNIFEALLEGWKHDVRNLWWIIDYNRQSLDAVVSDRLFGRIDALLNIAGAVPQIDLFEMTDAQWEGGLALKLHGARRLTIAAWPALKAAKGAVVLMSGNSALFPKAPYAAVGTINAAIVALAKAFSDRGITDGVQVNSVLPGPVMTGRRRSYLQHWAPLHNMTVDEATTNFPKEAGIARYGEPEEIAELMAFLVSPGARWMTGSTLRMDGGEVKSI